jgi:hypothetical protein
MEVTEYDENELKEYTDRVSYSIYVIQLEDECFFITISPTIENKSAVLKECEIMYDFAKTHKPVSIVNTYSLDDIPQKFWGDELNSLVKTCMIAHGIPYVRGGAYSDLELSEEQKTALDVELRWISTFDDGITFQPNEKQRTWIESNIEYLSEYNKQELNEEKKRLLLIQSEYNEYKQSIQNILSTYSGKENVFISATIFKDLDWIQDHIMNCSFDFTDKDVHFAEKDFEKRYKSLIIHLRRITKTFFSLGKEVAELTIPEVFLHHPEFVFDNYFLHYRTPRFREYDISIWVTMCDIFREMFTAISLHIKEIIDEYMGYPEYFETLIKNKLYLVEFLQAEKEKISLSSNKNNFLDSRIESL